MIPLTPLGDGIPAIPSRRSSNGAAPPGSSPASRSAFRQLSTLLDRGTRGVPTDFVRPGTKHRSMISILSCMRWRMLLPAAYVFHRESRALELLKEGDFRRQAGYLGLGQEIPADCSVDVFFLTDLDRILAAIRQSRLSGGPTGGKHQRPENYILRPMPRVLARRG